jgi:hypothetical protein
MYIIMDSKSMGAIRVLRCDARIACIMKLHALLRLRADLNQLIYNLLDTIASPGASAIRQKKKSDMLRSGPLGANAIIALRCCLLNGRFENYWERAGRLKGHFYVAHPYKNARLQKILVFVP